MSPRRARGLLPWLALAALAARPSEDVVSLNEKAKVALAEGRAADAVLFLESARALDGDDAVLAHNLAWAYFRRGQAQLDAYRGEAAVADYRRAADLHPEEVGYRVHLAALLLRTYRLEEAHRDLLLVLAARPEHGEANLLLGDVLNLLDRLPEALSAYEKAAAGGSAEVAAAARRSRERTARQAAVEQDYRTDATPTFLIRHPADSDYLILANVLDQARVEVCNALDRFPKQRAIVVLYPPEAFRAVTGTHEWVGGLFDRKIRLPIADPERDRARIESAFRHEYSHYVVSELAPRCPTFLNEGLAQLMEHGTGRGMARLLAWLEAEGRSRESVPALSELPASFLDVADPSAASLGYLLSYAFVDHVASFHGMAPLLSWVAATEGRPLDQAYEKAVGRPLAREEELFRELLRTAR